MEYRNDTSAGERTFMSVLQLGLEQWMRYVLTAAQCCLLNRIQTQPSNSDNPAMLTAEDVQSVLKQLL